MAVTCFKIYQCKLLSVKTAQTCILVWDELKPCLKLGEYRLQYGWV